MVKYVLFKKGEIYEVYALLNNMYAVLISK